MVTRGLAATLLTSVLAAAAGCSSGAPRAADPEPAPSVTVRSLAQRCGSSFPSDAPARPITLDGEAGTTLSAASFDDASAAPATGTALVLLHQTGPGGLCGWGRFATRAAEAGLPSVAIDMCGYGDTVCRDGLEHDPRALVDLAGSWARQQLGAERVVLVGASMGGSSTVIAVSDGAAVDAWVDVSGVSTWDDVRLQSRASALRDAPPGLIVYARSDGPLEWHAAQRLARTSGTRFVDGGSGHGYELMTDYRGRLLPAGRAVLRFATS